MNEIIVELVDRIRRQTQYILEITDIHGELPIFSNQYEQIEKIFVHGCNIDIVNAPVFLITIDSIIAEKDESAWQDVDNIDNSDSLVLMAIKWDKKNDLIKELNMNNKSLFFHSWWTNHRGFDIIRIAQYPLIVYPLSFYRYI